jgi:hypothetical protein
MIAGLTQLSALDVTIRQKHSPRTRKIHAFGRVSSWTRAFFFTEYLILLLFLEISYNN